MSVTASVSDPIVVDPAAGPGRARMRAVVRDVYGSPDVLRLEEVDRPIPGDDEVLIEVHAAGVNAADWHFLRGEPRIMRLAVKRQRIIGADVAGRVAAVGVNVTSLGVGDEVFGDLSGSGLGAFAEYVCAPAAVLAPKPARLSFEEAAAVPMSAVTALQGLRDKGRVEPGHEVLIHGASGGVGTFAVQIAKALGAEVTAVCSTGKVEGVRSLGADHVIDYTREDFARGERRYDVILAANGKRSILDYRRALRRGGILVGTGGAGTQTLQVMLLGPLLSLTGRMRAASLLAKPNRDDLLFLSGLIEARAVAPVIDRRYALAEVPDAIRYLEEGHASGKVVVGVRTNGGGA